MAAAIVNPGEATETKEAEVVPSEDDFFWAPAGFTPVPMEGESDGRGLGIGGTNRTNQERPSRTAYLPKRFDGNVVLVEGKRSGTWCATNKYLGADTSGLGYRATKNPSDKIEGKILAWETVVEGVDEGDWVRCKMVEAEVPVP